MKRSTESLAPELIVTAPGVGETNGAAERSARHGDAHAPPSGRPGSDANQSIRQASLVAGIALLLMSALAAFGVFIAVEGLVTQGDAGATAADVMASEGLFRLGVASLFLIVALDVVIAWALYRVFSPVSTGFSMLAAWFRLVYAGIFLVAIGELVGALRLLGDEGYLAVFSADQLHAQALLRINAFTDIWDAGLVLFGLHLLVLAYLAYRYGYEHNLMRALIGVAGVGYLFDSFAAALGLSANISAFTFVGEFLLALWLVFWGRRITLGDPRHHTDPIAVAR